MLSPTGGSPRYHRWDLRLGGHGGQGLDLRQHGVEPDLDRGLRLLAGLAETEVAPPQGSHRGRRSCPLQSGRCGPSAGLAASTAVRGIVQRVGQVLPSMQKALAPGRSGAQQVVKSPTQLTADTRLIDATALAAGAAVGVAAFEGRARSFAERQPARAPRKHGDAGSCRRSPRPCRPCRTHRSWRHQPRGRRTRRCRRSYPRCTRKRKRRTSARHRKHCCSSHSCRSRWSGRCSRRSSGWQWGTCTRPRRRRGSRHYTSCRTPRSSQGRSRSRCTYHRTSCRHIRRRAGQASRRRRHLHRPWSRRRPRQT